MRAGQHDKPSGLISAALLAVVVSLTGVAGAVKLVQTAVNLGPGVGDMISFDSKTVLPEDLAAPVVVAHGGSGECMLELDKVHHDGGSLVVEARVPGSTPLYQVHWAGKAGTSSQYDCGRSAELTLDASNLELLATAAGGWGAVHQPLTQVSFLALGGNQGRVQ